MEFIGKKLSNPRIFDLLMVEILLGIDSTQSMGEIQKRTPIENVIDLAIKPIKTYYSGYIKN